MSALPPLSHIPSTTLLFSWYDIRPFVSVHHMTAVSGESRTAAGQARQDRQGPEILGPAAYSVLLLLLLSQRGIRRGKRALLPGLFFTRRKRKRRSCVRSWGPGEAAD